MKKKVKNKTEIKVGDHVYEALCGDLKDYEITNITVLNDMYIDLTCLRYVTYDWTDKTYKDYKHFIARNNERAYIVNKGCYLKLSRAQEVAESLLQTEDAESAMNGLIKFLEYIARNSDLRALFNPAYLRR